MTAAPALSREAELEWEARRGPLAAGAAFVSSALLFGSVAIQVGKIGAPDNDAETLRLFDEHRADFMLSLGLQVASYVFLTVALFYLFRVTVFRRPETPKVLVGVLFLAPVLLGVGAVLNQLELNDVADKFVSMVGDRKGHAASEFAKDLIKDRDKLGAFVAQGGTLCLALSFVLVSLNAMRAGLLSRFMGVLGIIVGGLLILPLLPGGQSVVQLFWLVALGVLFLGRWPTGRGPAWDSGEAIPWPSAAELQAEREAESGLAEGGGEAEAEEADRAERAEADEAEPEEADETEPEEADEAEPAGAAPNGAGRAKSSDAPPAQRPHPASRKRKRKKRR